MSISRLMTTREAAVFLQVRVEEIYRLVRSGRLKAFHGTKGKLMIEQDGVEAHKDKVAKRRGNNGGQAA